MHLIKKAIIKLILLIVLNSSMIGCGPGYYFQKGEAAFSQKNYSEALINFKTVFEKDEKFPHILTKIETTEFKIAKKEDTIPAYKNFIKNYPEGHYCNESKRIIDNKLFGIAKKDDTIVAYKHYQKVTLLKKNSDGHWRDSVNAINRIRLDKANNAVSVKNYQGALIFYKEILDSEPKYPGIKDFIEQAEYNIARETNTNKGWQIFLNKYPQGTYTSDAKKELDQLLYQQAVTLNSLEAYHKYFLYSPLSDGLNGKKILNRMFSEGLRLLYAEQCKMALDYFENIKNRRYDYSYIQSRIDLATSCKNSRNKSRTVDFIKIYIQGEDALEKKQYKDALDFFERIKSERDFLPYKFRQYIETAEYHIAKQTNTEKALKDFLGRHPRGKHVEQANQDLNSLMERKEYNKAQKKGSLRALSLFITNYPNSRYVRFAKDDIVRLIDMNEKNDFETAKRRGIKYLNKFIKKYQDYQYYARYVVDARDEIKRQRKNLTRVANEKNAKEKDSFKDINKLADEAKKNANESLNKGLVERKKAIKDLQSIIKRIENFNSKFEKSKYQKELFTLSNELQKLCIKINPDISTSIH